MATTETKTFYPGAYDANYSVLGSYGISNPSDTVGKDSSNTSSYSYISGTKTINPFYASWPFDVSVIPEDAVINSVVCKARANVNATSDVSYARLQLYSGNTAKGSYSTLNATSTVYTITSGAWTRAELSSIYLRTTLSIETSAGSSTARGIQFYGADLTVQYTYQSEKFMLKLGGAWTDVARVFKKVGGAWIEVDDLSIAVDTSKKLVNGGECVAPLPSGYTELEYIEGTGSQYIDTGFKPTSQNVKIILDFEYTADHSTSSIFGVQNANTSGMLVAYGTPSFYVGSSSGILATTVGQGERCALVVSVNSGVLSVALNGTEQTGGYSGSLGSAYSLFLFANNVMGAVKETTKAKMYACRIYDGGALVRDFRPCISASGVVGLYDLVNDVFYQSASSTAFNAPSGGTDEPDNLITFTVGVEWQAEEGMTWAEFIDSDYNTGTFWYDDWSVMADDDGTMLWYTDGMDVRPSDVIIAGYIYDLM